MVEEAKTPATPVVEEPGGPASFSTEPPDPFSQLLSALAELEQYLNHALQNPQSPINRLEQEPDTPPLIQQGGSQNINHNPSPPEVLSRRKFNNYEIRQALHFPPPVDADGVIDYALYFSGTLQQVDALLQRPRLHARCEDLLQLKLRGQHLRSNISIIL